MLGRCSVPAARFAAQAGDSGKNGRITISGMAGISPDISVYRQAACGCLIVAQKAEPSRAAR